MTSYLPMKKNILLELDSFYIDRVVDWLKNTQFDKKYHLHVLVKKYNIKKFKEKLAPFPEIKCVCYEDLFSFQSHHKLDLNLFSNFNNFFFNNHFTARFIDRAGYYPHFGLGNQHAFSHYSFASYHLLQYLIEHKIQWVCFRNTPHNMDEWLLAQAIEFLKIDFFSLEDFIFPWLFTIKKGCLNHTELVFDNLAMNDEQELRAHVEKCVEIVSGNYEDAIPAYEKNRLGKGILKYYNPFKNLKASLKRPHQLYTKTKNFMFYKKHSKRVDVKNTKYLVFFLHYQPERSTLPEGYAFVDQFYTIHILSKMLPDGVELLVKEHPSMFTKISDPKFRNVYNYESILQLNNVRLVSMDMDSFSLIDHALAVATIKGTVTVESYIRSKPTIIFGKTNLRLPGIHNFESIDALQAYINEAVKGNIKIENQIENLTNACLKVSVSGLEKPAAVMTDYSFTRNVRENATYPLLTQLLNSRLDAC